MIEVRNVTKRYGKLAALEYLEIKIEKSSVYGLVGFSGEGKTTLLKIMMGIYRPDSGKVLVDGEIVYDNALIQTNDGDGARRNLFSFPGLDRRNVSILQGLLSALE